MTTSLPQMNLRKNHFIELDRSTNNQESIDNFEQKPLQIKLKQFESQENMLLLTDKKIKDNLKNMEQKNRTQRQINIKALKQIQEYRKISQSLNIVQKIKKANSQKLKKVQKNVSNLDFLRKLSVKQSLKIQHKRQKMEQTKLMVFYLDQLKKSKEQVDQEKWMERKEMCNSIRQINQRNKQLSYSVMELTKQDRIRQFKLKNSQLLVKRERNLEEILQQNRRKAQQIRTSELKLKKKLKKYGEYKVYLGKLNYTQRLEGEYLKHQHNKRYLDEVKQKVQQEDKLFRKTQKLKKQSKKIEDFYLTGTGTQ